MAMFRKLTASVLGMSLVVLGITPSSHANTTPNAFTAVGSSWIDAPESSKVYLENFGLNASDGFDDDVIYYVGAGITCSYNSQTATGPFLTTYDLGNSECQDSNSNPFDPIDTPSRLGAVPFGFDINFFGDSYVSAWPNTNGGIFYDEPDYNYDRTMANFAADAESSVMFPFGADLYYDAGDQMADPVVPGSNFWTAQTTVDGKSAIVFSWERFRNCCGNGGSDEMSVQLVLIDQGSGDFNAYFNYDSVIDFNQGYRSPYVFVDLETDVTVGSNVVVSDDAKFVSATCTESAGERVFGTATDTQFNSIGNFYYKLENLSNKTISLWTDNSCQTPINVTATQDVQNDKHAYFEFRQSSSSYYSVAVGWATYDSDSKKIDWTELLRNVDSEEFKNGGTNPLISQKLNTNVPGRFVIGQRGGQTVTDSSSLGLEAAKQKISKSVKSIQFATSSKVLTKKHKAAIKKVVRSAGTKATYTITGVAGRLPGVTTMQVKKLATLRAMAVKAYLVKLGVKKANIKIKIKITNQGIVPKTKILAKYLTS